MKYKIVKDKKYLSKETFPVETIEEGEEIASKLKEALIEQGNFGLGLAANQIGIDKQVAVVNVDGNFVTLMNPIIREASEKRILYTEGCLSIPGKILTTVRHESVTVECLNWANPRTFGPADEQIDIKLKRSEDQKKKVDKGLLECVVVQHEINHLNGILITDQSVKFNGQVVKSVSYGRNDKVMIEKDGKSQFIKYKKAEPLLENGWKIV